MRIVLRSIPLATYLLLLPYVLVQHVIRPASARRDQTTIILSLSGFFLGVFVLQALGAVRVYHSWQSREEVIPPPPVLHPYGQSSEHDTSDAGTHQCWGCFPKKGKGAGGAEAVKPPVPPNTFLWTNPSNMVEITSLVLEFVQMASFSLQINPYHNSSSSDDDTNKALTDDVEDENSSNQFWGEHLFRTLYVHVPVGAEAQYALMWGAVAMVILLIAVFSYQFFSELRIYGELMTRPEDKDIAKDSFFFSFTGAIVYGHGNPSNISRRVRFLVAILSDTLFLVLSFQLLQIVSCNYFGNSEDNDDSHFAILRANASVVCWESRHARLAIAALTAYAFYVPLSIMITPMLLQAPPSNTEDSGAAHCGGVSYLKLYVMTVNIVKSVMLLVVILGPEEVITVVVASSVSSLILGALTLTWFQRHDISKSHYSADVHPCNIAFINYWKAASYTAAVLSAMVIVLAHILQDSLFRPRVLTSVLISTWVIIVAVFYLAFRNYDRSQQNRQQLVRALILYPFRYCSMANEFENHTDNPLRNVMIGGKTSPPVTDCEAHFVLLPGERRLGVNIPPIPGFNTSPWYDSKIEVVAITEAAIVDYEGKSLTHLILIGHEKGR